MWCDGRISDSRVRDSCHSRKCSGVWSLVVPPLLRSVRYPSAVLTQPPGDKSRVTLSRDGWLRAAGGCQAEYFNEMQLST